MSNTKIKFDSSGWKDATSVRVAVSETWRSPVDICVVVSTGNTYKSININYVTSQAIDSNDRGWAWGDNLYGQIGNGLRASASKPQLIYGNHTFCSLNGGSRVSHGLDINNKAWGWGYNYQAGIGDGTGTNRFTPVAVCGDHTFCKIFGGAASFGIDNNNVTWGWGDNYGGQIGINNTALQLTPVKVCGNHTFNFIGPSNVGSYACTYGLDNRGKAWSWGKNQYGSLGDNSNISRSTPVAVCGGHTFCVISRPSYYSYLCTLAIDNRGKSWGWGFNGYGVLGDNTETSRLTPIAVCGGHTFCKISSGYKVSTSIDNHGKGWSWGDAPYTGTNQEYGRFSTPISVYGGHTFCEIISSLGAILARDNHDQVWGWGYNIYGVLGDNSIINRLTPVKVCQYIGVWKTVNF